LTTLVPFGQYLLNGQFKTVNKQLLCIVRLQQIFMAFIYG